jgi:hypothetical protein
MPTPSGIEKMKSPRPPRKGCRTLRGTWNWITYSDFARVSPSFLKAFGAVRSPGLLVVKNGPLPFLESPGLIRPLPLIPFHPFLSV